MLFDIVICHGPKDDDILEHNLRFNKQNIIGYNNIYVITYDPKLVRSDCIVIHESVFPFNINTVKQYYRSSNRYGWYLQQLLKLYASFVIPGMLDYYLVIDCDTLFVKPTTFFEQDIMLFNYSTEYHLPYFNHMSKMSAKLTKVKNVSGICHHMLFSKKMLQDMFELIEHEYNQKYNTNYKFYAIFLRCVDPVDFNYSGASEYETYFNFMLKYHHDKIKIRKLSWCNTCKSITEVINQANNQANNNVYVSVHWYQR